MRCLIAVNCGGFYFLMGSVQYFLTMSVFEEEALKRTHVLTVLLLQECVCVCVGFKMTG